LFEDLPQRFARSDDLFEIQFAADFIFEVELFLRQFLFQFGNLA
jgi:hypothetical protein